MEGAVGWETGPLPVPLLPPPKTGKNETARSGFARVCAVMELCRRSGWDHEEAVDEDVEAKCGEGVARVVVVPHADLHGADEAGVEEEEPADQELACKRSSG